MSQYFSNYDEVRKFIGVGQVPTIPPNEYKSTAPIGSGEPGAWLITDLEDGQLAINVADGLAWYRSGTEIIEIVNDTQFDTSGSTGQLLINDGTKFAASDCKTTPMAITTNGVCYEPEYNLDVHGTGYNGMINSQMGLNFSQVVATQKPEVHGVSTLGTGMEVDNIIIQRLIIHQMVKQNIQMLLITQGHGLM